MFAKKPVKRNQKGLQCDQCNQWFHTRCCSIDDQTYNSLADTSCMWICSSCDTPIFSNSLFSSPIKAASNSFDPLVNLSNDLLSESLQPTSSEADLGRPRSATKRTSTSRKKSQYLQKLKELNLNCNSIRSQHKSGLFKAKVEDENHT